MHCWICYWDDVYLMHAARLKQMIHVLPQLLITTLIHVRM